MSKFVKVGDVVKCVSGEGWSSLSAGVSYTVESLWEGGFALTNGTIVSDMFMDDFQIIPQQSSPQESGIIFNNTFYPVKSLSEMYALLDALHTIEEITQNGAK